MIINYLFVDKPSSAQSGYVALASVLVITAISLIIGMSVTLLSINGIQTALSSKKNIETTYLVESCVEEALLGINENNAVLSSIVLPEITCSVTTNSQTGTSWDFTVSGTFEQYTQQIRVQAERNTTITITSWNQI